MKIESTKMKNIFRKKCRFACNAITKHRWTIIFIMLGLIGFKPLQAQVNVSVNIVSQPLWGPVNYNYVEYYYLPEANAYYYVPSRQFIYWETGRWMSFTYLPASYHIDLYRTYKVVVNEPRPYMHHKVYVTKYGKYKNVKSKQVIIRDSHDKKYYVVKGHPGNSKVKATKTGNTKPGVVKSKSAKPASAKPKGGNPGNSKSGSVKPGNSKSNGSKPGNEKTGGSKPQGSKGNEKKNK